MSWLQLKARIAPDHAEILEHLLMEEGACAITLQDAEDQPLFEPDLGSTPLWSETVLTGLWDGTEGIEAMRERVKAGWAALIPDEPCPEIEVEILEDRDWAREWMDGFEPLKMGQRLWIVPSWHDAPEQDAVNLMLDPGPVPGMARWAGRRWQARPAQRARLRLRFRHSRHRRAQARRGGCAGHRYRPAGAAGLA